MRTWYAKVVRYAFVDGAPLPRRPRFWSYSDLVWLSIFTTALSYRF